MPNCCFLACTNVRIERINRSLTDMPQPGNIFEHAVCTTSQEQLACSSNYHFVFYSNRVIFPSHDRQPSSLNCRPQITGRFREPLPTCSSFRQSASCLGVWNGV